MNKISLYRIKLLCGVRENSGTKTKKRITPLIFAVMSLLSAGFFVWLNPVGLYNTLIYFSYMPVSYILFSPNIGENKTANYLLLPASAMEKIIAHLILAIGIPTLILAVTIPAIVLFQGMINLRAGQTAMSYMPVLEVLTLNNFLAGLLMQAVGGFAVLTFRRMAGIKALILGYPFIVIVFVVNMLKREGTINETEILLINGVFVCLIIGIWIINYYKLKKIEI